MIRPFRIAVVASFLACSAAVAAGPVRHVVVITVDGLRPDALSAAPTIAGLARDGAASLAARTVDPAETLPAFVAMATGLSPARHGVTYNNDRKAALTLPHLFRRVHEARLGTALYFGKSKIAILARPDLADMTVGPAGGSDAEWQAGAGAGLTKRFAEDFPRRRFALAWLHLREPDVAGHGIGWMTPAYLSAVREADARVALALKAIDASGVGDATAVILTADHGGNGRNHDGSHPADRLVPWLCRVPGAKPGTTLAGAVTVMDTAPTALALLGLPPLPDAEGRAVSACLP